MTRSWFACSALALGACATPDPGETGETVELAVTFESFTLVDPTASPPPTVAEGEGHYHVYADGTYLAAAWEPTVELTTAPEDAGFQYEIEVGLVDSGHTDLNPPVEATATLTVE